MTHNHLLNSPKFLALLTVVIWSFGALLTRLVAINSQFILLSLSFFFSLTILMVYLVLTKSLQLSWFRDIRMAHLLIGPLGYLVYSIAFTQSSRAFNSISESTILNDTWPIFTVLFSDLLFHKIKKPKRIRFLEIIGLLIGFLSIIILTTGGHFSSLTLDPVGITCGLIAGISYGIFGAYSGTLNTEEQKKFLVVGALLSVLVISIPAALESATAQPLTLLDISVAFALGAVLDGIGYILWTRAIRLSNEKQTSISLIASLMFFLPPLNLVIVNLFLGENQLFQPVFGVSLFLLLISTFIIQKAGAISSWIESRILNQDRSSK